MNKARMFFGVLCAVACGFIIAQIQQHTAYCHAPYHLEIDPVLSPVTHIKITDAIHAARATHSIAETVRIIAQQFPCIESLQSRVDARGLTTYVAHAHAPLFALNDTLLLLSNGAVVPRLAYNEAYLVGMRQVHGAEEVFADLPKNFKHTVEQLFALPGGDHHVYWQSSNAIWVTDSQFKSLRIVCAQHALPTEKTIAYCAHIYQTLAQQRAAIMSKKKQQPTPDSWVADIRFKNQIVIRADVGGHLYG